MTPLLILGEKVHGSVGENWILERFQLETGTLLIEKVQNLLGKQEKGKGKGVDSY